MGGFRFGGNRVALHFGRKKHGKAGGASGGGTRSKGQDEASNLTQAQQIVKELYHRYEKQLQRWQNYRNLFGFLGFVALFLAVLYLQRNAHVAYDVHETIQSVVVPGSDTYQSTGDVYAWIQNMLQTLWVDPVCGDGLCESPFEFASYGRFGCRADCGRLADVQKLTTVQLDLYWDFSHPAQSIAASDLMQQATWNLCPIAGAPSPDCYYDSDQTFDSLTGEDHRLIDDMPDGQWQVAIKRDIFNKVSGAVRDTDQVATAAYYDKLFIALMSARAEQSYELQLLQQAMNITNSTVLQYLASSWTTTKASNTSSDIQSLVNATCLCDPTLNVTATFKNTTWPSASGTLNIWDAATWANLQTFSVWLNGVQTPLQGCGWFAGSPAQAYDRNTTGNITLFTPTTNLTAWCLDKRSTLQSAADAYWGATKKLLFDMRVGDNGKTSGKTLRRYIARDRLLQLVQDQMPEKFDAIYTDPAGLDPLNDPVQCQLDEIGKLLVDSPLYYTKPAPAAASLTRVKLYLDPTITAPILYQRAAARIAEVQTQQTTSLSLQIPLDDTVNTTIKALQDAYTVAGGIQSKIPDSRLLGSPFNITYDYVGWPGNTTSYLVCDLNDRGADYVGTCVDVPVACNRTQIDGTPWVCTDLKTGAIINGTMASSSYRGQCESVCEHQLDCNTLCECYDTCDENQECSCKSCQNLYVDAKLDGEFQSIEEVASQGGSAAADISDIIPTTGRRRRLAQSNTSAQGTLTQVLTNVQQLQQEQQLLTDKMQSLTAQVKTANDLAVQRSTDKTLEDLIKSSRQDIQSGQQRVEAKLDQIISQQNQLSEAAQKAAASMAAIQDLNTKQLAAAAALEKAVNAQLYAIKVAAQQSIITVTQAFELWKRTRRDKALANKASKLSNIPCKSQPEVDQLFNVTRGNQDNSTNLHRERNIGLTNRVIGGMLVHSWRSHIEPCSNERFSDIGDNCTGGVSTESYGVDPVFNQASSLYNPDLDDVNGTIVASIYNCSDDNQVKQPPTYNNSNPSSNQVPFCKELFNPRNAPWGFRHFPLKGLQSGFPVWFDIDLSADDASNWFTYLQDGLYLDQNTRAVSAQMITYNAELQVFGDTQVQFTFGAGGSVKVRYRIYTLRIELYQTAADRTRFGLEIILSTAICLQLLMQLYDMALVASEHKGNILKYFVSTWHWVDAISASLLVVTMALWWVFVARYASKYDIDISYPVYAQSGTPDANYLMLDSKGDGLRSAWGAFSDLHNLIDVLNWYYALNGINILLLIARVLKLMDFQPRLGIVTRSLAKAAPDLLHFAIVFGIVFIGYAILAHLIFGNVISSFHTFSTAINTCFEMLLGNIDVNGDLRQLTGLMNLAGTLFFWSYMLLVFMVLLNFLLAIIVDAFAEVKSETMETTGLHTEVAQIFHDKWKSFMGVCTGNYVSDGKLGKLLKQWAGGDDEPADEQKLVKEPGETELEVMGQKLGSDKLKEVLEECLQSAPRDDDEEGGSPLKACLPKTSVHVSNEELEQVVQYLLQNYPKDEGAAPVEEKEEENAEQPALSAGMQQALEKERDQLAQALERLADVQRELADGQRTLMSSQKQLADQQARLVRLMQTEQ